jgi:hypothetical protein
VYLMVGYRNPSKSHARTEVGGGWGVARVSARSHVVTVI